MMTEDRYRLVKAILLAVLVAGGLWFARSMSETYRQHAENGRFVQYEPYKEFSPNGTSHDPNSRVIDTRTGEIKRVGPK